MTLPTNRELLDDLRDEFIDFCNEEGLPHYSAEDLLLMVDTFRQTSWLTTFINRWNEVEGR